MRKNGMLLLLLFIFTNMLLAGCLKGEQTLEEIDVPEEVEFIDDDEGSHENEQNETEVSESEETVRREIYLLDANGLVVPQTLELPKTKSAAMQALQYMIKDGPVTELLPNGFQAVLPAGTEIIGLNLQEDGTLIVDVSEEFKNYEADEELQIIQAMTHTLTQFDNVERIKLWINGENQTEMPVNGTPISEGYSIKNGINIYAKDKPNLTHSEVVTMYYPKQYNDHFYYVPMTQYIETDSDDLFTSVVQSLIEGPSFEVQALQVFNDATRLTKKPFLKDGVLQLIFSEEILLDQDENIIADEVMQTLVKSLTALEDVEAVKIDVENKGSLVSEDGTTYDKPVTIYDIEPSEKM